MTKKERDPMGITEAAGVLGVHPNTLRKWADEGIVPHVRLPSGYRRFRREELDRFRRSLESPGRANHNGDGGPQPKP